MQNIKLSAPSLSLYVPIGHFIGAGVPFGQYYPLGH
jgi:hypothetical protein